MLKLVIRIINSYEKEMEVKIKVIEKEKELILYNIVCFKKKKKSVLKFFLFESLVLFFDCFFIYLSVVSIFLIFIVKLK